MSYNHNTRYYMDEGVYMGHLARLRRLTELEAPELILRNEQYILDHAVVVQTDEYGRQHFPASAAPEDADRWLEAGCGCEVCIPRYRDPDGAPDTTRAAGETLDLALELARQDGGRHLFALYGGEPDCSLSMTLPLEALGSSPEELFRAIWELQDSCSRALPEPLTVRPCTDGCVTAHSGPLLLRVIPTEDRPREWLHGSEGPAYLARLLRDILSSEDPCLLVLPQQALAEAEERMDAAEH